MSVQYVSLLPKSILVQDYNPYRHRNISESTVSSVGSVASGVPHVPITDLGKQPFSHNLVFMLL